MILRLCCPCRFLDGHIFQWTQALALIFVLFGPDVVALMSAPNSIDPVIDALLILSMAIFALDLILSVACRPKVSSLEVRLQLMNDFPWAYFYLLSFLGYTGWRAWTF